MPASRVQIICRCNSLAELGRSGQPAIAGTFVIAAHDRMLFDTIGITRTVELQARERAAS
jgi:hypothetical protein